MKKDDLRILKSTQANYKQITLLNVNTGLVQNRGSVTTPRTETKQFTQNKTNINLVLKN